MRRLWLLIAFFGMGCGGIGNLGVMIDDCGFSYLGYTAFSDPDEVTLKEIHLDTGGMKGREVVVEGTLLDVGDFSTFAILGDESARMLVILTKVLLTKDLAGYKGKPVSLRVLGTVSGGQMGLPFVDARAVRVLSGSRPGIKG